ncbi:MAG: hypothetical protein IJT66_03855 [Clostridia bacterium]|nr:hypothetical protein [Clostridia bacterium]
MKKRIAFLLLCVVVLCSCHNGRATAFTVNGHGVEKDELLFYMNRLLDVTVSELETQYDLDETDQDFWNSPAGDTTPLEILKSAAVEKITRIKVELLCAGENGIERLPLDYSAQMRLWKRDNDERQRKDAHGETVYGSVLRSFYSFFQDGYLSTQNELKAALEQQGKIVVSEGEMKTYYAVHRAEMTGSFEEMQNTIYGWIANEKYEKYVDSLVEQAKIVYQDMTVDPADLT